MSHYNDRPPRDEYSRNNNRHDEFDRGARGGRGTGGGGRGGYGGGGGARGGYARQEEYIYPDYHDGGRGDARGGGGPWQADQHQDSRKRPRYDDYDDYRGRDYEPSPYEQPRFPQAHQHPEGNYHEQAYQPPPPQHYPQQGYYEQYEQYDHQQQPPAPQPPHYEGGGGRSRDPRPPPTAPDPPSASVVLLGLPLHVNDVSLRHFLEDMGASVDSTTVIIDRQTGLSKRYGFAKFSSVEHARAFVEPNFPTVSWKERVGMGPDDGLKIKINYSQKTGGWREDQGAGARLTEDQRKAAEASAAPQSFYVNDGTRDVGTSPTQILLLRGLDPLSDEEEIVQALGAIPSRAGTEIKQGGVKKVMITKDRASRSSWGYAFVQFSDVRLANDVLGAAFNTRMFPAGLRIRNSVVAFSYCHENSFVPIYARSEWSFKGEGGQQLAYWDDKAFVSVWEPVKPKIGAAPVGRATPTPQPKKASAEDDMEAFFSSLEADLTSDSGPTFAAPVARAAPAAAVAPAAPLAAFTPIVVKPQSTGPGVSSAIKSAFDVEDTLKPPSKGAAGGTATSGAASNEKKKSAELIVSRKAAVNISKWNTKQAELKEPEATPTPLAISPSSVNATPVATAPQRAAPEPTLPPTLEIIDEFPHGDPVAMICLLCQRQFKTPDDLRKHNKLSALHKTNLANPTTVAECAVRKTAATTKNAAAVAASLDTDAPKYVDRAAARREAFHQTDKPKNEKRKKFEGPPPPAVTEQPNKDGIEESNVGSKMLEKMGWSKGVGLGASGSGIVDPVQAAQFAQGAGLGSTKGTPVGTFNATPAGYAESLREKAKSRYESL